MSTIGERVERRRKELELTQDELANRLGYSHRAAIYKIETGKNNFPIAKLDKFAEVLNCSKGYLLGTSSPETEQKFEQGRLDAKALKEPGVRGMLRKYMALPENKRKAIREYVENVFNEFFNG